MRLAVKPIVQLIIFRMYDELKKEEGNNPTIGWLLCSDTSKNLARYSILKESKQLFAAKYLTCLPSEEEFDKGSWLVTTFCRQICCRIFRPQILDIFLNFGSAKAFLRDVKGNRHPMTFIIEKK